MSTALPTAPLVLAFHGTGGGGGPVVLLIFLAAIATFGWLLFSKLRWRQTMMVLAGGWVLVLGLSFAI